MPRMLFSTGNIDGLTRGKTVWGGLNHVQHEDRSREGDICSRDDKGVMMYVSLEQDAGSNVELAIPRFPEDTDYTSHEPSTETSVGTRVLVENVPPSQRCWVPSTTKLSVYATWWGYRLYLPPHVMSKLNSKHIKTTQRAAMVTSALKWSLGKVPLFLLPLQVRETVKLLKRLVPVVGYIGLFVSWSWAKIMAYDKGNGVVLTATWLLPVALIPMSWDVGDIFDPRPEPAPRDKAHWR